MISSVELPPHRTAWNGHPRRVGVEIEFGNVALRVVGQDIAALFGGTFRAEDGDPHRVQVCGSRYGDFTVELDSSFAHRKGGRIPWAPRLIKRLFHAAASEWGHFARRVLPSEVVCPPVEIAHLAELDRIIDSIRRRGGTGTEGSAVAAFGLQLNPDLPSLEVDCIRRHMQAYLVLSPWLRAEIHVNPTRKVSGFVKRFPDEFAAYVTTPAYRPDQTTLIDDYLRFNPTRNRELDFLPLFGFIDEARVRGAVDDPLIKTRPTFHYRLPDSEIDDPSWGGITEEWNRWVRVERLAADDALLVRACAAFHDHLVGGGAAEQWQDESRHFAQAVAREGVAEGLS